jgi:hypothetical protein
MNKKTVKKKRLIVSTATIRNLDSAKLVQVVGGAETVSGTNPQQACHPV